MFKVPAFVHNVPGPVTITTLFEPELMPIDPEVSLTSPPLLITNLFDTPVYPTVRVTGEKREPAPSTENKVAFPVIDSCVGRGHRSAIGN